MFGETLLLISILFFILQSSNLWSSLILIPTSMLLIWCFSDVMNLSNIILSFMLLLIFIGGLLILLVSVAILSFQDQGTSWSLSFIVSCTMCSLSFMILMLDESVKSVNLFVLLWLTNQKSMLLITLLILSLCLLIISFFLLKSMNFLRSI